MKNMFKSVAVFLLAAIMLTAIAYAETGELDDENYYKILNHNLEKKDVWLNPGQHVGREIPSEYLTLSDEIVGDAESDLEKLDKIYEWVTGNIYYDYDAYFGHPSISDEERASGKTTPLQLRRGVCASYASILKNLLNAQGIPCLVINGRVCNQSTCITLVDQTKRATYYIGRWTDYDVESNVSDHAWNAVYLDGEWIDIDSTWDSRNEYRNGEYFDNAPRRGYYGCGDEMIAYSHKIIDYPQSNPKDIPDKWAQAEVLSAITAHIVPNTLQQNYREPITRQEFCALAMTLWDRTFDADQGELSASPFSDTHDAAVIRAYEQGIVNGIGNGLFAPDKEISRQEAATMLMRLGKLTNLADADNVPDCFADQADVADWGIEGVDYVRTKGLMAGTGRGFSPRGTFTIQEAILTFSRLNSRINAS